MGKVSVRQLRQGMSDAMSRVAYQGERIIVERNGRPVAALVPVEDLEAIEALEDRIDLEEAKRILADPAEKPVAWSKVKKKLGL